MRMIRKILSELFKLISTKVFLIVAMIIIPVQSALGFVSAKQILSVGLNAVPTKENNLIEAMPPIEYFGFDVVLLSVMALIVMGAIFGAMEYKRHCMRTTLVYMGNRRDLLISKTSAVALLSFVLSFVSVFMTILVTHMTFKDQGLPLIVFNATVWKFMMSTSISLTAVTLLSYAMGFIFKTAIVPMIFLIVQAYNIGELLASKFRICRYLPIHLSNTLIPSSPDIYSASPVKTFLILVVWILVFMVTGYMMFSRKDLRGEY